jgi:hypothetical protein
MAEKQRPRGRMRRRSAVPVAGQDAAVGVTAEIGHVLRVHDGGIGTQAEEEAFQPRRPGRPHPRSPEMTVPPVVSLTHPDDAAAAGAVVTQEVLVLDAAQARDDALRLAERGDFKPSPVMLRGAAKRLRAVAPRSAKADELLAQAQRLEDSATLVDPASFGQLARKMMHYQPHQNPPPPPVRERL